ncbi:MAG: NAD(P)H-dependent oxidoreductase subunit E [Opitutales bacterium]|nr:NAD(P)H-dependent oxidoreductase subunit E [Opitutales bacterium]
MAFELSQETLDTIDKVIPRYPQRQSALMMILHAIQKEQGYLSLEAQEWVAERLEIAPIKVREVVTFYPFYREKPVGKHYIRVCRTLSCALNGSYKICDRLCQELDTKPGEISPDGKATVEFAECLASCGTAPVVMVDDDMYENLTEDDIVELARRIREEEIK